ncbi:MAG: YtxH domain-containing protein [Alistipes sp.]|nr:YtxH domain-containing protein [Alistipes sp.]MBQ3083362.1 YtxH domain-containing protein [Alistipes sp.]MBQ8470405.1 YtxH domain-containing protein [Alistipes sp.]
MKHTTICVAAMLGGMIIGSALAMLLTPQSGPELRHRIKDFVDDEVEKMKSKAEAMHDKLKAEIEEARCKCEEHVTKA